jgi:hypothetical protein
LGCALSRCPVQCDRRHGLAAGREPAPTAFSRLADAGSADRYPGADHVVVLEHDVNRVKPSGVTDVDGYRLLKILTAAGCRDQAVLTWHYDPQSQLSRCARSTSCATASATRST